MQSKKNFPVRRKSLPSGDENTMNFGKMKPSDIGLRNSPSLKPKAIKRASNHMSSSYRNKGTE